jgi:phosphatidylglycerol:prolipoprotein diacylglycerol transferase
MFLTKVRFFPGLILGLFLLGYGLSRSFVELFREPDAHLGFILGGITMGQFLSSPMIMLGIYFSYKAIIRNNKGH